jgi:GT2 family glycosyltransferase
MNDSKVAVVILNFNGRHFLEKFLPSIVQHSAPHQVYVADNGSTDDSIAWTKVIMAIRRDITRRLKRSRPLILSSLTAM